MNTFSEIVLKWMSQNTFESQLWFRKWLGAVGQQAITCVNVDPDLCHPLDMALHVLSHNEYCLVSNIRRTLVGNKSVDHSDVVGASPVGAAPTTSSFST